MRLTLLAALVAILSSVSAAAAQRDWTWTEAGEFTCAASPAASVEVELRRDTFAPVMGKTEETGRSFVFEQKASASGGIARTAFVPLLHVSAEVGPEQSASRWEQAKEIEFALLTRPSQVRPADARLLIDGRDVGAKLSFSIMEYDDPWRAVWAVQPASESGPRRILAQAASGQRATLLLLGAKGAVIGTADFDLAPLRALLPQIARLGWRCPTDKIRL